MIVTADEALRDEARIYRDQGKAGFLGGDHVRMGYAWRMSEPNAAIGLIHHRRLDEFLAARRSVAAVYDEGLAAVDGVDPAPIPASCGSNYYKYIAMLAPGLDRQEVKDAMRDRHGVSMSGEVYALPLHRQPVFADVDAGSFPVADDVCARHVCLPVHSDMTVDEAAYVIDSLAAVVARGTATGKTKER
jgi:dTDP-4-amino-4,6-dideoxygalactose transaminase